MADLLPAGTVVAVTEPGSLGRVGATAPTVETVECPDCGGPTEWNRTRTRLLWHRRWQVGRGGLHQDATAVCTGGSASGGESANKPAELLVREGSDAAWAWLEELHREQFTGGDDGR